MDSLKQLLEKKQLYIVGVSGGCDSMALLDMLFKNQYHIVVCHVNYHLRHDSDLDQQVVSDYCHKNQIPCFIKEIDPNSYGRDNFQQVARSLRYQFYLETGNRFQTKKVILAHHLDDIIETVVMQLQRKNTKGYLGIKEVSHVYDLEVIRPCLSVKKEFLRNYCHEHLVPYRDDYTNFETNFTRDYVRNVVLKDYDDKKVVKLLQWKDKHNQDYFDRLKQLDKYLTLYHQNGYIDYTLIPEALLESFIYEIVKEKVYPPKIGEALLVEIIKQLKSHKPNIIMTLPVNTRFIKEYNNIRVTFNNDDCGYWFQYDQLTVDNQKHFHLSKAGHLNEGVFVAKTEFPIVIRTILPGDEIVTAGGKKKVARLFINNKVPQSDRKLWPIVVNNQGEIILVPHLAKNIKYLYLKPNLYVVKL